MAAVISVIATANGKETDGSPVVFSFSRTGDANTALSVSYQLFGTAQAGSDYTGNTTGTINFAAGSSSATLSLPALADGALIDPYETIIARINPGANYEIATGKQFATATITAEGMVVVPKGASYPGRSSGEHGNSYGFAALKNDGSVVIWPYSGIAPAGLTGVSQIFSNSGSFVALKNDGSVVTWGSGYGVIAPAGLTGVSQIFSNGYAFAALKKDGSVVTWGNSEDGGVAPAGLTGVSQIFSDFANFAALKDDGSVVSWGRAGIYGTKLTEFTNVSQIISRRYGFTALKKDGSVFCWGYPDLVAPAGLTGISQIFSNQSAFAALKSDGSVVTWSFGTYSYTPEGATNVSQIFSTDGAFAALKSDGSVVSWGLKDRGGSAPAGLTGVSQIFSTNGAFAALKDDATVVSWGGGPAANAPVGLTDVIQIFSTGSAFAALKKDGSVVSWGDSSSGGIAPVELKGVSQIFSTEGWYSQAFAALKSDGSVISWGGGDAAKAPAGLTGVVGFANPYTDDRLVINDMNSSYSYYSSTTNKALKDWNIYRVDNSVKAGDIVSQWFGTATPTSTQLQDISETKLMDVVASTWADKVQINRVVKASDTGGKIEAKQIDWAREVAGSVVSGGKGNDEIKGFAGWDNLEGGDGNDLIHGGNGRDIISGGAGRDELHGDFGWNTYKSERDGVSDLIAVKSDHYLVNWLYGKAGNSPNGEKSDIIEGLDPVDKIKIIGVDTSEITFAANVSAKGVTGIGIYGKGILEALYTGGDLTVAQISQMTSGDASAAAMSNSVNSYGVW